MYIQRLETLVKAYRNEEKNNKVYKDAQSNIAELYQKRQYVNGIIGSLQVLDRIIAEQERLWQEQVLRALESRIVEYLSVVYPTDGYTVQLSTRILRGKVHVEGSVKSFFTDTMSGDVSDTQGRLFQQIVSFAALVTVMEILGAKTIYVDEAFSGASKKNVQKINELLRKIQDSGFNIVLIAQDPAMASNIDANVMLLTRSIDNKTSVQQVGRS